MTRSIFRNCFPLIFLLILAEGTPRSILAEIPYQDVPRTVLGLYYDRQEADARWSPIHRFAEMPLNHLGVKVIYHNMRDGLPDVEDSGDLLGILSWFRDGTRLDNPVEYLLWLDKQARSGKKIVIMGDPGFRESSGGESVPLPYINRLYRSLGIKDTGEWVRFTYDLEFTRRNADIVDFERKLTGFLPSYDRVIPADTEITSHLVAHKANRPDLESHLVITSAGGGYVARGYEMYVDESGDDHTQLWYLNPFNFFRLAFNTDLIPKADTTTLAGRRIYYSHMDGDGWLNKSFVEEYREKGALSSEVILENIVKPYPDLPVTISVVAAEIDPDWVGTKESRRIAKAFFALPQVEIGSHTYSHPFDWSFFASEDPELERGVLRKYPNGSWGGNELRNRFLALFTSSPIHEHSYSEIGGQVSAYEIPRAYAKRPFSLEKEIGGAAEFLNQLAPEGKKTEIIMWTGDTTPFEKAIQLTRLAGLKNINGGDSRYDKEYPSVSWISPIGREIGKEIQIYSSNSNENTYTELWRDRFHGFRFLIDTLKNTESPVRLKPINLYYHAYSGERLASLNAIITNLKYIQSQQIIPIRASQFCEIATGFYSTRIQKSGPNSWKIMDRGGLQTIRFDDAELSLVDTRQSSGVIGYQRTHGSLYVYLDQSVAVPNIVLSNQNSRLTHPYLESARWRVWEVNIRDHVINFNAGGWGQPEMVWRVPEKGIYEVEVTKDDHVISKYLTSVDNGNQLFINPESVKNNEVAIQITYIGGR